MRRSKAVLLLVIILAVGLVVARQMATSYDSAEADGPSRRASSGTLRTAKPCGLLSADEMSELLGGPIGTPSGESSEGKTSCTYPPADAGSRAQAEVTIAWNDAMDPSFERQLVAAFRGSAAGERTAHAIALGDEAAYSAEGVLSIRSGSTLVTIALPQRPDAEERAIAVGRRLFATSGATASASRSGESAGAKAPASDGHGSGRGLAGLASELLSDISGGPPDEEVRVVRPTVPDERGAPVMPEGLMLGGDCPPAPPAAPDTTPSIVPLVAGLTLAHVWKPHSERGDEEYECLLQVTAVTAEYADVTYTCDNLEIVGRRRLCRSDLRDSHFYLTEAADGKPTVVSGATMFSLSTRSLQELKATTNTAHRYIEIRFGWEGFKQPLLKDTDGNFHSGRYDRERYTIIMNDRTVDLPVLTGLAFANKYRQTALTVLDNEPLPLVLDYSVGAEGFRIRYTRISFPNNGELEKRLATDKHVDVYGIYFDFASDRLRPESAPVLDEIATVLTRNAGWTLSINGHTDNIGGDASNLALSRRRSEAVRKALVERYHIDGTRLVTSGYGASQPKATNDTPEGRSRNRRVELVRQ